MYSKLIILKENKRKPILQWKCYKQFENLCESELHVATIIVLMYAKTKRLQNIVIYSEKTPEGYTIFLCGGKYEKLLHAILHKEQKNFAKKVN